MRQVDPDKYDAAVEQAQRLLNRLTQPLPAEHAELAAALKAIDKNGAWEPSFEFSSHSLPPDVKAQVKLIKAVLAAHELISAPKNLDEPYPPKWPWWQAKPSLKSPTLLQLVTPYGVVLLIALIVFAILQSRGIRI